MAKQKFVHFVPRPKPRKRPGRHKKRLNKSEKLQQKQKAIEAQLADKGLVLIRASGTEPLIRVMVQGEHQEQVYSYAKELAQIIESDATV